MTDLEKHIVQPSVYPGVDRQLQDAWVELTGKLVPDIRATLARTDAEACILATLLNRASSPLRVVLGFNGYASETSLRQGFLDYLKERQAHGRGATPAYLPSLVICGASCLVCLDGMPFAPRLTTEGEWPCLGSSSQASVRLLLEFVWTRLSYRFSLGCEMFGDDLLLEPVVPLLDATCDPGNRAWKLKFWSAGFPDRIKRLPTTKAWTPAFVSKAEFVIVNMLCRGHAVRLDDPGLLRMVVENGETIDGVCASLREKRIAAVEADELHLLTIQCGCVTLPDGRFAVGENVSGRLERWVTHEVAKAKGGA